MLKDKLCFYELLAVTTPTGATTHQENDFTALLEPKLRKVFFDELNELPEQYSKFYKMNTSKKAKETDYGVGSFTPWAQFGTAGSTVADGTDMPKVPYAKMHAGLERTYTHQEFAKGIMVERKFIDDELYGVIEKQAAALARAGRYKVEQDASSLFNDALLVSPTQNQYDAKKLFVHDHPLVDGGATVGDNLIEGVLSATTLKNALLLGRKQVDEAGKLVLMNFDTIVVPPALEYLAHQILKSDLLMGTANNDINPIKGRLKIEVWDFLTKDDACFIMDSKNHNANFFWRVKPEFNREKDFDSLVSKYMGYMRYSYGVSDYRGLIGIKPVS